MNHPANKSSSIPLAEATRLRITPSSQTFILKELALRAAFGIPCVVALSFIPGVSLSFLVWALVISFAALEAVPSGLVHYQYYLHNRKMELSIDPSQKTFTVVEDSKNSTFHFDEVTSVRIALRQELFDAAKRGWFAWELYHYAVISTNANKRIVVTCLLYNDLRDLFPRLDLPVVYERRFFSFIAPGEAA